MRLYALCDQNTLESRGTTLEAFVAACQEHGAEVIQYRNKSSDIAFIKQQLIALRALWDGFLIVNDKFELTPFCDGVHIGQEDLYEIDSDPVRAVKALRSVIGSDKILGLSTHNAEEIAVANGLDLNYIGLGAYRATATKDVSHILGEKLDTLASASKHPVAAIGGVRFDDRFKHVTYHVMGTAIYES